MDMEGIDFKVVAVLPAAGCGERTGLPTPKQFCSLQNRPLISHTLGAFEKVAWISHTVVVVSANRTEDMNNILTDYSHCRAEVVEGDTTRHRSIYCGIKALQKVCEPTDVVIIHDAVRPFVDADILSSVAHAAKQYGAAGAVRPLVSTVIATDAEGFLEKSLDRSLFRASEMPQAFQYGIILEAYQKSTQHDFDFGTECLHLAQKYTGTKVKLIDGPVNLWKVTHRRDLYAAEGLVKESKHVSVVGCKDEALLDSVYKAIRAKGMQVKGINTPASGKESGLQCSDCKACQNIVYFEDNAANITDIIERSLSDDCQHVSKLLMFVTSEEEYSTKLSEFLTLIQKAAEKANVGRLQNRLCINGILSKKSSCHKKLGSLVASLVFDSNVLYSGQVFHV